MAAERQDEAVLIWDESLAKAQNASKRVGQVESDLKVAEDVVRKALCDTDEAKAALKETEVSLGIVVGENARLSRRLEDLGLSIHPSPPEDAAKGPSDLPDVERIQEVNAADTEHGKNGLNLGGV